MAGYREPTPEELEESRDPRLAMRRLSRLEVVAHHLDVAASAWGGEVGTMDPHIEEMARKVRNECTKAKQLCSGRVESRRRPRSRPSADSYTIYLDECGQHAVAAVDTFPVFVLAAAIIRDADYPVIDALWKRWKHENLGGENVIVHEPDLRRRTGPFRGEAGAAAISGLQRVLAGFDFGAVVIVVHRADYVADYGVGPIDNSLPEHAYLMALDFLMERCLFALDSQFGGGRADVIAESRGPKEDAMLQHEFARLHFEGTSYISHSWFRQQLHPGIRFMSKRDNNTGLQIADLLARPVGVKVADPTSDPPWWDVFRPKLCKGSETKHSLVGLKIVPWRDRYANLTDETRQDQPRNQPQTS